MRVRLFLQYLLMTLVVSTLAVFLSIPFFHHPPLFSKLGPLGLYRAIDQAVLQFIFRNFITITLRPIILLVQQALE